METTLINRVKSILGYEVEDNLISMYVEIAKNKILTRLYPYDNEIDEVPKRYEYKIIEITVYLINKIGAEGQISHTENGITRIYENADIPKSMISEITPYVKVL